MHRKKLYAILRICFVIIASAVIGLNSRAQDTIVLKTSEFDRLANELMTEQKLSQNFRNGFDSLRTWYNDLLQKYEQSQTNLASCMQERDTAHAYITRLRTDISRAWQDRDKAIADAVQANNRKKKAFGIGPSIGWNPFTKSMYGGIGVHWSLVRFSLRGLFDGETKAEKYNPTIYSTLNH